MRKALRCCGSGPVRILSVTGTSTAPTTASQTAATSDSFDEQRRACRGVAHLLRRATHVDVDDLRAAVDVVACRLGHHRRIGTRDLHGDRRRLTRVIGTPARLVGAPQLRIRRDHLRHRIPRTEPAAQLPERTIGDAGHRRDGERVGQLIRTDAHEGMMRNAARGADYTHILRARARVRAGSASTRDHVRAICQCA